MSSGFCISYEVRDSPGRGNGIFAKSNIPANTLIWKFSPGLNVRLFHDEREVRTHLETLSDEERYFWLSHVYVFDGKVNEILDDGKMWNHSERPNCGSGYNGDWDSTYSLRDIEAGEELLDDYGAYEYPFWFLKLCEEFNVPQDFFTIKCIQTSTTLPATVFTVQSKQVKKAGFHIQYEIKESSPELGMGLFAKQFIPRGALIWKYVRGVNVLSYPNYDAAKRRLNELSPEKQQFWISHVYMFDGNVNEILDDACMWNHSETPNTGYGSYCNKNPITFTSNSITVDVEDDEIDWNSSYAIRDIYAGEELLDDYGIYEYPEWFLKLTKEYNVPQDFIVMKPHITKPGFHVPYEIRESPGKGLGLFASDFIPKGSLIWKYVANLNVKEFNNENDINAALEHLPNQEKRLDWLSHAYGYDGKVIEILDDALLWNHDNQPNCGESVKGDSCSTYALRDIEAGEELLEDYRKYDWPEYFVRILEYYKIDRSFLL